MKYEDAKFLCESFPIIYRNNPLNRGGKGYDLPFYFECESGWTDLIAEFSSLLEKKAAQMDEPPYMMDEPPYMIQVKEKFGGLRLYSSLELVDAFIHDVCNDVEKRSFQTCEFCGQPGKLRKTGWIKTMCEDCFSLWNEKDRFTKLYEKYSEGPV